MAYTTRNFKSKKALKDAIASGESITVFQPGPFPLSPYGQVKTVINGEVVLLDKVALEGPHYPEPHRWYAEAWIKDGKVVKVK